MKSEFGSLERLARMHGVQGSYVDVHGRKQRASADSLQAALQALGAPLASHQHATEALRAQTLALWQTPLEPVAVVWGHSPSVLKIRLPSSMMHKTLTGHLILETGEEHILRWPLRHIPTLHNSKVEGTSYQVKGLPLPNLPAGYHRVTVDGPQGAAHCFLMCAPVTAYIPKTHTWGVFCPLYALHSDRSWGSGDWTDLDRLREWVAVLGGQIVGTLPLLASFLDEPFDPSPYAPVSRLFWNEFFLDVTGIPEVGRSPEAQALLRSSMFQAELNTFQTAPLVDYRRQMSVKRQVLEALARSFFSTPSDRLTAFWRFVRDSPGVDDYARFRATCERQHSPWTTWPAPLRDGTLAKGDYEETAWRYHLYAQWLAHEQLDGLARKAHRSGQGLYLDLPLGVHALGYDTWRERTAFALDVSGGAPPDAVFTKGQSWGFPPLHPHHVRDQRYRYPIAYIRHHLQFAKFLRIDHMMGLHRLFWIPKGMEPRDGVYVRYAAEEFYAILSLESHRHQSVILGENLGTVPPAVNNSMKRHGIHQMYVVQYELTPQAGGPLRPVPADSVASLNTHDMPTFHAYCQGQDIPGRLAMGLLDKKEAEAEHKTRQALVARLTRLLKQKKWLARTNSDALSVVKACWAHLAASPARVALVNLEDLWLETKPQNVPGLGEEGTNWLQKTRHRFEVFSQMPQVLNVLREVNRLRTLRRSARKKDEKKGKSSPKKGERRQKKRLHARPI